jgi:hypothetical protein
VAEQEVHQVIIGVVLHLLIRPVVVHLEVTHLEAVILVAEDVHLEVTHPEALQAAVHLEVTHLEVVILAEDVLPVVILVAEDVLPAEGDKL